MDFRAQAAKLRSSWVMAPVVTASLLAACSGQVETDNASKAAQAAAGQAQSQSQSQSLSNSQATRSETSTQQSGDEYLVKTQDEYFDVVDDLKPGDKVVLANGNWADFEILFQGKGEEDNLITLTAETKGEVFLTGQSNLRLAGEYLHVNGLVFKDGHTPTKEVVAFRQNKKNLANNSRISEIVIDNFNQTERREPDFWVMMYGKNNRFDHNYLAGKNNAGVTMAVRLNEERSQQNYHRIDHNYFGPRQILGSNGGETLRIGTSHYSRTDSHTVVENNYFDRRDGELEIISNKSGRNAFLNNTFFESRGTLTMRHGNNNVVENNVFFGNGVEHTGGIRVINAGQTIRNNYMEGLKGTRFGGALVVMNGVPNGPINRYDPVINALIERNSLINSDNLQLGAGSDTERSGVPEDSDFNNNLISNDDGRDVFTVYDDMSGITFKDNILASMDPPDFATGFTRESVSLSRASNGLLYPTASVDAGVTKELVVTTKDMTGPSWYPKPESAPVFGGGKTIRIEPGEGALFDAVKLAGRGDTIELAAGDYTVSKFLKLDKALTFKGRGDVSITFERSALFEILDGGSLQLIDLNISGEDAPDYTGNSVIRTSPYSMLSNFSVDIQNCDFVDMDVNRVFNIFTSAKGTFADNITVANSSFEDVSGSVFALDKESDDFGIYNAEYLTISDSTFKNIQGTVVDYYRGGTDESTFGPHLKVTGSTLENVGNGKRNKTKSSLYIHGVQVTNIEDNVFKDSAPILINHTVGEPKTFVVKNRFSGTKLPINVELNSGLEPTAVIKDNELR